MTERNCTQSKTYLGSLVEPQGRMEKRMKKISKTELEKLLNVVRKDCDNIETMLSKKEDIEDVMMSFLNIATNIDIKILSVQSQAYKEDCIDELTDLIDME